jgi:hypothetical protein
MHTVHNLPFELASGNLDQSDAAPTYVEASARQEQNTSQSAQLDISNWTFICFIGYCQVQHFRYLTRTGSVVEPDPPGYEIICLSKSGPGSKSNKFADSEPDLKLLWN